MSCGVEMTRPDAIDGIARHGPTTDRARRPQLGAIEIRDRAIVLADLAEIAEDAGLVDVLVNNAGIIRRSSTAEIEDADWVLFDRVNFCDVVYYCLACCQSGGAGARLGSHVNKLSALGGLTCVLA